MNAEIITHKTIEDDLKKNPLCKLKIVISEIARIVVLNIDLVIKDLLNEIAEIMAIVKVHIIVPKTPKSA
jgi:hypothetical protein